MAPAIFSTFVIALRDRIAVGKQYGEALLVCMQNACKARHHIRPIRIERDAAETLRFALREIAVLGAIQAGELRVAVRLDAHHGFENERFRYASDAELVRGVAVFVCHQRAAVDAQRFELQLFAIEQQRAARACRIAAHGKARADAREACVDRDVQVDRVDEIGRRRVVLQVNRLWRIHGNSL